MDNRKIPWIECVVTLPEQVEENFNKLINIYKKKSRSKKKLKKKISRITTEKLMCIDEELSSLELNPSNNPTSTIN